MLFTNQWKQHSLPATYVIHVHDQTVEVWEPFCVGVCPSLTYDIIHMYLVVHIHKHTYIYNVDIHIQICMYAFKVPLKYVGIRMLQDLGQARREEFGMQVGSMEHRPSTSRDSTKRFGVDSKNKTHRPTDLMASKMDPLQQLVRTRKECCETYYDRTLCDTDYSGISDDDSLSSSSSFCEYYGRGGRLVDEPNGMSFGGFKTRNKKPSSDVYSTVDDSQIVSERCNRESVLFVDQPVLIRTQGSDFSGVAFRRRRQRRQRTLATNNISTTREDIEESPTSLLQKCRSDVDRDPTMCSTLAPLSTVVHPLTPGQSALLLSQRRLNARTTTSKKLLDNKRIDEDVDGVGKGASKGNVEGPTTAAPVATTESVEENSSDGSTAGSLWMTEELIEEASQQSEASLQILLRHIFSWERDVWCQ